MKQYILAIDQGTTNSRAIIFDSAGMMIGHHETALNQSFPQDGWVEQDPVEMFNHSIECCRRVLQKTGISANLIAALGITNQRETTILWDKKTGQPVYPAIVWQDRRTAEYCQTLKQHAVAANIHAKTGLLLDPYFSATKIAWILEHVPGVRARAEQGEILFGTVETWLLWKLTAGRSHVTDATNASRTMLLNIHTQVWDQEILAAFNIPAQLLPVVQDNAADFGVTESALLGAPIKVGGMAGDQQAATIGQACFKPGMLKVTFGTGCFMVLNTGDRVIESKFNLISTIAYRIGGKVTYALEGSIFCAGVTIKWLRDQLHMISSASETAELAASVQDTGGVYLVPAFTGLGAPYWDPHARGALTGLTCNTNRAHIVRAGLESVVYQTRDLLDAMLKDSGEHLETIRVDGGMAANDWLLQFLADMLDIRVERPACIETTSLGVAYLAGLQVGIYQSLDDISKSWQQSDIFVSRFDKNERNILYKGWQAAVRRVMLPG